MEKQRIGIFASGTGSNAMNLIRFFEHHPVIEIAFVLSNKSDAKVLVTAKEAGIQTHCLSNDAVSNSETLIELCRKERIDWVLLAGYLRKVPDAFIQTYATKIINLHPSLLPKYGGKGMYGMYVHQAVVAANEPRTGITIHYVNEEFDKGEIIAQFHCPVTPEDTPENVAKKIHTLEQSYLPLVIEATIKNRL